MRILQQAGGTHRQWILHRLKKRQQVLQQRNRKRSREKAACNLLVVIAVNSELEKVVIAQEAIEDLGGQHQRRRHGNADAGKLPLDAAAMQQDAG